MRQQRWARTRGLGFGLAGPAIVATALAASALAASGAATGADDGAADGAVQRGAEISAEYCARCHDIAPGGAMKEDVPSFAAIAVYRSPEQIRGAMLDPHLGMPPLVSILGLEADDLIAYIVSLEETATWRPAAD